MNLFKVALTKLGKVFLVIAALIRRMFCCIRRRRRNSDTPLPITADVRHLATMPVQQFPTNEGVELHNWSTWDDDNQPSAVTVIENEKPQQNPNGHSPANYNIYTPNSGANIYNRQHSNEMEVEIDYFQDMTPAIKKTTKIIVKKRDEPVVSNEGLLKRLAVDPQMRPIMTNELGHWEEEEGSWEDSMDNDIICDANAALKESKQLERERRNLENQKKKMEKDALRLAKKDHLGTKLS